MAQRLATEYVKARLQCSEAELSKLIQMSEEEQVDYQVKVLENGNQRMLVQDPSGEELVLTFEPNDGIFVSEGSYKVSTPNLANFMRKAVAMFRGAALVNRIYHDFTMVYYYENGVVVKIVELSGDREKVIYEYRNALGRLEQLYRGCGAEKEIRRIQRQINELLDRRNRIGDSEIHAWIDARLQQLTHQLFVLEA